MKSSALASALAALIMAGASARGAEYSRTITFREPLGYTWTDELVHRDVRICEAKVAAGTFALADAGEEPQVRAECQ